MPTISDVAKLSGLSRTTVSRVINQHPYVSKEKKEIVLQAMKKLGYTPNFAAQHLRKQKTNTIAVLVPKLTNPFFAYLVESIEEKAVESGYQILICNTKYDKKRELAFLRNLKSKQVDGIIMTNIQNNWQIIDSIINGGPIVLCNEYTAEANVPTVRLNQVAGSYNGTYHLIEKGYTKIGYCWGGIPSGLSNDRLKGYKMALTDHELTLNKQWIFPGVYGIKDGIRVMEEISKMKDKPDAIFSGSDEVAAGIVSEAKRQGIIIPDELAVMGFDNQPIAEVVDPALTTISQPITEIGKISMEIMLSLLSGEDNVDQLMVHELPLELVVRKST